MLEVIAEKINSPTKKYMAVSRLRRFGKIIDVSMIGAFFGVGSDIKTFKDLKITRHAEICVKHQGKYYVIKIDMSKGVIGNPFGAKGMFPGCWD